MKKLVIFLSLFISFNVFSETKSTMGIPHSAMNFKYMSYDGQVILNCKHTEINEWYDWEVYCGPNREKVFSVHLALSKYQRDVIPKNSYELLYWLTDRTDSRDLKGYGSTVWVHLREPSQFYQIKASVSVDNDTAGLYLTLNQF